MLSLASVVLNGIYYVPSANAHDLLDSLGAAHLLEYPTIGDYKDGFGVSRTELLIDEGIGTALDGVADAACPGTNAACLSVTARHEATKAIVNNIVDTYFEDYAEWWQVVFWEGCPELLSASFPIPTDLCPATGASNGILGVIPQVQSQISTSRIKSLEIRATTFEAQKNDDAKRIIQEQKAKSLSEHHPSEELCKFASVLGGRALAKNNSDVTFSEGIRSVRYAVAQSTPVMADEKAMSGSIVTEILCREANHEDSNASMLEICGTTTGDIDKPDIGDLIHKGNWDDTDRDAAVETVNTLFASNRPYQFPSDRLDSDKGRESYMNHRSVMSREMLGSYCTLNLDKDKMGGSDTALPYLRALLEDLNISVDEIDSMLGTNPSLYTQRKVLLMVANQPQIGNDITDNKENILRISNMIEGYKLSAMYEALDVMYCNQMEAAQLFTDELLPFGTDVQEQIDSLRIVYSSNDNSDDLDYAKVSSSIVGGGE